MLQITRVLGTLVGVTNWLYKLFAVLYKKVPYCNTNGRNKTGKDQ